MKEFWLNFRIGIPDGKNDLIPLNLADWRQRIDAFFISRSHRYAQAFLRLSKNLSLSLSLNQSSLLELPGFHLNTTLYIMVLRDPTGILSEQETSKLNESNHCNLLKAWYFVSRALIHNLGGQKHTGPLLGECPLAKSCHYKMNNPQHTHTQAGGDRCLSLVFKCQQFSEWIV